jgi:hypothetical protein
MWVWMLALGVVSFLVTVIVIELATIPDFRPSRAMFGPNGHRMIDFDILPSSEEADPWTVRNVRQHDARTNLVVVTFVYFGVLGFI